jgi:hypothetical protein
LAEIRWQQRRKEGVGSLSPALPVCCSVPGTALSLSREVQLVQGQAQERVCIEKNEYYLRKRSYDY